MAGEKETSQMVLYSLGWIMKKLFHFSRGALDMFS